MLNGTLHICWVVEGGRGGGLSEKVYLIVL